MDFGLLGPVEVRSDSRAWPVGSGRERFVLATLLLNGGQTTTAEQLIAALWRRPPTSARSQLHNMISNLRRRLRAAGGDPIVTRAQGYELPLAGHRLDVATFRELAAHGRQAARRGDHSHALAVFTQALAVWRGPALADVPDELAADIRQMLHDERLAVAETRLDAALALHHYDDVLHACDALLAEQPYREHLYRRRMLALVGLGRRAEALATYRRAYRRLTTDLGVTPGPALRELEQQILRGEDTFETTGPQAPEVTVDSPVANPVPPRQLPPATAPLTGRDPLLAHVVDALRQRHPAAPTTVLLVGPGGVGKTSLALAAAHTLADTFPDGSLHADMRGSHDRPAEPHVVIGRMLRALGVKGTQLPEDPDERVALYRSHLADRRMLIVLDDVATEAQVRPLLPGSAGCGVLITSRRQLAALVEATRLTVPVLAPADAVALLARGAGAERVAAEADDATAITELCGRLPLAVCIAAARLAVRPDWSLAEFRRRLESERHRLDELAVGDLDVRASIGLSYRSLPPPVRTLLRRLALVAAPDWPGWVADALAEPGQSGQRLLDQLTDVHLVQPLGRDRVGQPRYQLHDLVADFATERGHAEDPPADRETALARMLDQWLVLATVADDEVGFGAPDTRPVDATSAPVSAQAVEAARAAPREWFEVERANLVAAVTQACRHEWPDLAGALALRLYGFLTIRSYDDRENVLTEATACARRHGRDALLAPLLRALYGVYSQQDRYRRVATVADEALQVARRLGDPLGEALCLTQAARAARLLGQLPRARQLYDQSLAIYRQHDAPRRVSTPLVGLAEVHLEAGDPEPAIPLCEEALEIEAAHGTSRVTALMLHTYAVAALDAGRPRDAERALSEALTITQRLHDDVGSAYVERLWGDVDVVTGTLDSARDRLGRAYDTLVRQRNHEGAATTLGSLARLAVAEGRLVDAAGVLRRALRIWQHLDCPLWIARSHALLSLVLTTIGDTTTADLHRQKYRTILADLALGDRCLLLHTALGRHTVDRLATVAR